MIWDVIASQGCDIGFPKTHAPLGQPSQGSDLEVPGTSLALLVDLAGGFLPGPSSSPDLQGAAAPPLGLTLTYVPCPQMSPNI